MTPERAREAQEKLRRQERTETELKAVRGRFTAAFVQLDRSVILMRQGLQSLVDAHNATSRGELSRHRLSVRLEALRSARTVGVVISGIRRRVSAARGLEIDLPDSASESFARFVTKVGAALELLEEASREIPAIRAGAKGRKVPPELRSLLATAAGAASTLSRVSKRGRTLLRSHTAAVEDDVNLEAAFD